MRIFKGLPISLADCINPHRRRVGRRRLPGLLIVILAASAFATLDATPASASFGLAEPFTFNVSGSSTSAGLDGPTLPANPADHFTQAGGHPFEVTASFQLNLHEGTSFPDGDPKDARVTLPQGLIGNPRAVAQCPLVRLTSLAEPCPVDSQVGVAAAFINGGENNGLGPVPIYNLVPESGQAAEFGFLAAGGTPIVLYASVGPRSAGYSLSIGHLAIPTIGVTGLSATFWGVPADPAHDPLRAFSGNCLGPGGTGQRCHFGASSSAELVPFLSNPTDCSTAPAAALAINSYQDPDTVVTASAGQPVPTGCAQLAFDPRVSFQPDTAQADTPAGYVFDLAIPQTSELTQLATPQLKDIAVALPGGINVNPSAADGLAGCTEAQIEIDGPNPATCPPASQLGTVEIHTPLLAEPLKGQVFLGTPACAPCTDADATAGRLLRLYIQARGAGVTIKLPGSVSADPTNGSLTARFTDNPQLPFDDLKLDLKGGARAPLANPPVCGEARTTADLVPWSAPATPDATPASSFTVNSAPSGGPCASDPAALPFAPSFSAGTTDVLANEFSPLTLTFGRTDGQQTLSQIRAQLPPGLLGMISTVPLCGEPQASDGTCAAASLIGHTTVAAGSGSEPFHVNGEVYLTGPYEGAPFGLSVVVPAVAGPFNLGEVVVRAAINVDPHDAHVTVTSDPFPQILAGVPLRVQSVNVTIDRPGFTFNPTSCAQQSITATIAAGQGASANVSNPFEVGGCRGLPFSPKMTASLAGRSSKQNGASLNVKIVEGVAGEANVHFVKVELPKQLPARLSTLQKACTAAVFEANPANCPPGSIVGTATARTPVLPVPLTGPGILVSHGGEAFPDLVIVLQGDGVTIDLVGNTDIKKGVTSSTFATVPDAPVTAFELRLPTGPFSILGANLPAGKHYNFCGSKLAMPTKIIAQNGAEIKQSTKLTVTGCPRRKASTTRSATTNRRAK